MIYVQIDLQEPGEEPGDSTAIWSGELSHVPQTGNTIEIRGGKHEGQYRVTGAHWILFASARLQPQSVQSSVIVYVIWD
jgi:hypothetical protein